MAREKWKNDVLSYTTFKWEEIKFIDSLFSAIINLNYTYIVILSVVSKHCIFLTYTLLGL